MTDRIDLVDWADVAAVGICVSEWMGLYEHPLAAGVADAAANPTETSAIAAALREAFEAGQRESCRELSARRAVDGWLRDGPISRTLMCIGTSKVRTVDARIGEYRDAPDYPALAAALGLEVEDE